MFYVNKMGTFEQNMKGDRLASVISDKIQPELVEELEIEKAFFLHK